MTRILPHAMMGAMHRLVGTRAPWLLAVFVVLACLNVLGTLAYTPLAAGTKPLLMPVLLVWTLANAVSGSRPAIALMAGLFCAFLGDVLLQGDAITYGLGAFALMQIAYLLAFRWTPGPGLVRAWPLIAVPYVAVWLGMNAILWSHTGDLRIPVVLYSVLLVGMALAALDLALRLPADVRWLPGIGGALFIASDGLLALRLFAVIDAGALGGAIVMATYCAAQFLIVTGLVIGLRRPVPTASA